MSFKDIACIRAFGIQYWKSLVCLEEANSKNKAPDIGKETHISHLDSTGIFVPASFLLLYEVLNIEHDMIPICCGLNLQYIYLC